MGDVTRAKRMQCFNMALIAGCDDTNSGFFSNMLMNKPPTTLNMV